MLLPDRAPQGSDGFAQVIGSLRSMGLLIEAQTPRFMPLTGGVSSDILLAEVGERRFCIKRALPRLKVAALWEAPVARNGAEAAWLRTVAQWLPRSVPRLLGEDAAQGLFAMEYLPPERFPVWKNELRDGRIDAGFAAQVGARLATIHRLSARRPDLAAQFAHDATFESIRIEPYLRATAQRHPDLAGRILALADTTLATKLALVHGDVSPKNILCGPHGPVFLDAECAWYGDPAFDLAFCLNHLLLKGAWKPQWKHRYRDCMDRLAQAYLERVDWEPVPGFEARCAGLLPALWLARVDGKSPAEYLVEETDRAKVRQAARRLLENPVVLIGDVADFWSGEP